MKKSFINHDSLKACQNMKVQNLEDRFSHIEAHSSLHVGLLYPPQTLFVVIPPANFVCRGYTVFTLSVRPCVRPSVTLCFLNILKGHCWIFIKPCKHVHICKTNFLDKKARARGQFYQSYFPF